MYLLTYLPCICFQPVNLKIFFMQFVIVLRKICQTVSKTFYVRQVKLARKSLAYTHIFFLTLSKYFSHPYKFHTNMTNKIKLQHFNIHSSQKVFILQLYFYCCFLKTHLLCLSKNMIRRIVFYKAKIKQRFSCLLFNVFENIWPKVKFVIIKNYI